MNGLSKRYIPHSTPFSKASLKTQYLSGGRLFGLKRADKGVERSFGLSKLEVSGTPLSASALYVSSADDVYLYFNGSVYLSTGAHGNFYQCASDFASKPYFVEIGKDSGGWLLISDGNKAVSVTLSAIQSEDCPPLSNGVRHCFRLFGTDKEDARILRWSAAGDELSWDEGLSDAGYVRFNDEKGGIQRLIVFNNKLIAVQKYGLTVVRAYGDTEDFRVETTDTATDEIYGDTAAVCAGGLMFFTLTGLYVYDGGIKRVAEEELEGFIPSGSAAACGNFYFACGTLCGENVIACVDGESGNVSFIRASATCVGAAGRAFCFSEGYVYEIVPCGDGGEWIWSGNFGSAEEKYIDSVTLDGSAEKLTVSSGNRTRAFTDVSGTVKVGMRGFCFAIEISGPEKLKSVAANYALRG